MAKSNNNALQKSKGCTQLSQDAPKTAENGCLSPVILLGCCIYQERSQIHAKETNCDGKYCIPQKVPLKTVFSDNKIHT
jgi:hypothetical protein